MFNISSKQKKIIAGLGIMGGIGTILLIFRNRLGFGDTPVELWRRGNNNIRANRKSIAALQDEARQSKKQAGVIAIQKQEREKADEQAEWNRREAIWRTNRQLIEAAKP